MRNEPRHVTMAQVWDAWLDLVLGASCVVCRRPGRLLCRECCSTLPTTGQAVRPDPCPPGLLPAFAAGEYDGALRALVLAHKEHRAFALAGPLARALAGSVLSLLETLPVLPTRLVLVPVPSRPVVVRRRGHDPMRRVVLRAASRCREAGLDTRMVPALRQRVRPEDQAGLSAGRRAQNLVDTMAVRPQWRRVLARSPGPVTALVCDDVLTTGATAGEAQRALLEAGIPASGIACVAATRKRSGGPLPFCGFTG